MSKVFRFRVQWEVTAEDESEATDILIEYLREHYTDAIVDMCDVWSVPSEDFTGYTITKGDVGL